METHGGDDQNAAWFSRVMKIADPHHTARATDVLLGRGRKIQQHRGNIQFLQKVDECLDLYQGTARGQKHRIVSMVMNWVRRRDGRFLKKDLDDNWVEATDAAVKIKVAQAFRRTRRLNSAGIEDAVTLEQKPSTNPLLGSYKVVTAPIDGDISRINVHEHQSTGFVEGTGHLGVKDAITLRDNVSPKGIGEKEQRPSKFMNESDELDNRSADLVYGQEVGFGQQAGRSLVEKGTLTEHGESDPLVSDEEILRAVRAWELENGLALDPDPFAK